MLDIPGTRWFAFWIIWLAIWRSSNGERRKYWRLVVCSNHVPSFFFTVYGFSQWECSEGIRLQNRVILWFINTMKSFSELPDPCIEVLIMLCRMNACNTRLTARNTHLCLNVLCIFVSEAFSSRGRGSIHGDWHKPNRISSGKIE